MIYQNKTKDPVIDPVNPHQVFEELVSRVLSEITKEPKYTVLYNIVSVENKQWVGTGWEFFDDSDQAMACYDRHIMAGNCPCKRPYHKDDRVHLGAVHRF